MIMKISCTDLHRNRAGLRLVIIFLIIRHASCFGYVMGDDDRMPVNQYESAIPEIMQTGMIKIQDGTYLTGLLTGANCDVVISAGHAAVYWKSNAGKGQRKGQLRDNGQFQFYPEPAISMNHISMELVETGYHKAEDIESDQYDWSVFRLQTPVSGECKNVEYMEYAKTCQGQTLMPGFHFDRPDTRMIDRTCQIKDTVDKKLLLHNCDTKDGSSGAPLLCLDQSGISIHGINISGLTKKGYFDPGVYGMRGRMFNYKNHKNYAIAIHGRFLEVLKDELQRSKQRMLKTW